MNTSCSEEVVPLIDMKAVMQSVSDCEDARAECAFMRAVVAGLADLKAGREVSLAQAKARFGLH